MADYFAMNHDELTAEKTALEAQYKKFQGMNLKLNMARGKPGPHQMDLAMDLLKMDNYITDNGFDTRNYGELEGLPEARALFADVFGVQPGEVFVGGNSSLQLMYNLVAIGMMFGFQDSPKPWGQVEHRKFLCPVPGYDRHFAITEEFGFELISVPMTPNGPDMDVVEKLVAEVQTGASRSVYDYNEKNDCNLEIAVQADENSEGDHVTFYEEEKEHPGYLNTEIAKIKSDLETHRFHTTFAIHQAIPLYEYYLSLES